MYRRVWGAVPDEQIKQILNGISITDNVTRLLNQAETVSKEQGDNMSAIGLQWGDKQSSSLAVSTLAMAMGATTTIMNPVAQPDSSLNTDLSDDDIERTIAEIQQALQKTLQKNQS